MKNEFKILLIFGITLLGLFLSFYFKNQISAATCGNGVCEAGEVNICCIDCPPTCGNGICESNCGENASNCSIDCASTCGNGVCEPGENPSNCCIDCYEKHYEKKCYDNDVYWYDCNGQRNDKAEECGDSEWTNEYRCNPNDIHWIQRKYINRGCSNAQCYSNEEWKNYQYCSNYCLNAKCILPPAVITKGVVITY